MCVWGGGRGGWGEGGERENKIDEDDRVAPPECVFRLPLCKCSAQ